MLARKGRGKLHGGAGNWFFVSMLVMTATAAALTWWEPDPLSLLAAILTGYLVTTSWMTAHDGGRRWRRAEWAALPVALACALFYLDYGFVALTSHEGKIGGFTPAPFFIFGSLATLAAVLDLNMLLRKSRGTRQRIARHLWRMCTAFFLAATSLFLGQQDDVFPFMLGSPLLLLPSFGTLGFMGHWLVRVGFAKQWLPPTLGADGSRRRAE